MDLLYELKESVKRTESLIKQLKEQMKKDNISKEVITFKENRKDE